MAKKRVHEIAKAQGLTSKELLAKLKAAGVEAKAAQSSVEESDALAALKGSGDGASATATGAAMSETARQAAAYISFWSFIALLFGAVAAPLAGMLGGELRDDEVAPRRGVRKRA